MSRHEEAQPREVVWYDRQQSPVSYVNFFGGNRDRLVSGESNFDYNDRNFCSKIRTIGLLFEDAATHALYDATGLLTLLVGQKPMHQRPMWSANRRLPETIVLPTHPSCTAFPNHEREFSGRFVMCQIDPEVLVDARQNMCLQLERFRDGACGPITAFIVATEYV